MDQMSVSGPSRRHPTWGIVAQVVGAFGIVVLTLAIAATWFGWSVSGDAMTGLVGDLDTAAADAIVKAEAIAIVLEDEAAGTTDAATAEALRQGATLTRELQGKVTEIDAELADVSGTVRLVLLITAGAATGVLVYLILVHAGVFTLGRHWRRD